MRRLWSFALICGLAFHVAVHAQDNLEDEIDLTELDEFGDEAKAPKDGADEFDLENPSQDQGADSGDDLEKELEQLDADEPAAPQKPAEDEFAEFDEAQETPAPDAAAPDVAAPEAAAPSEPVAEEPPAVASPEPAPAEAPPSEPAPAVAEAPAPVAEPVINNEPNSALEARLDRIFQKFMSAPTTDEEWLQIAGEKASETYNVQSGDTLWDISVTFFGNGNFWPKIWQLNDDITNPHVIQPGRVIKFTPGSLSQAPSMQVTDAEAESGAPEAEAAAEAAPEEAEAAEEVAQEPPIPPAPPRPPVVNPLPQSLPLIVASSDDQFDKDGVSIERQPIQNANPAMTLSSVLKEAPTELGQVVGIEHDLAETAAVFQYIYVELAGGRPGDNLTVYEVGRDIEFDGEEYGASINYLGRIQIIEAVEGDRPDLYKAMVTRSIDQVKVGAKIAREDIPVLQLNSGGTLRSANGEVIGGPGPTERKVFADNQIAFLNIGNDQGVRPGDLVQIVRNEIQRNRDSVVRRSSAVIGTIKIAQVGSKTSTGVVVKATEAIRVGDLIASGVAMNSSPSGLPGGGAEDLLEDGGDMDAGEVSQPEPQPEIQDGEDLDEELL